MPLCLEGTNHCSLQCSCTFRFAPGCTSPTLSQLSEYLVLVSLTHSKAFGFLKLIRTINHTPW